MTHQRKIVCPFYVTHVRGTGPRKSTVTCENIKNNMGFEVRNMLRFGDREELDDWISMFCDNEQYEDCEYYKAIYKKYQEDKE